MFKGCVYQAFNVRLTALYNESKKTFLEFIESEILMSVCECVLACTCARMCECVFACVCVSACVCVRVWFSEGSRECVRLT